MATSIDPDHLIGRIYEAAVTPDLWPDALQGVANLVGAKGSAFITRSPDQTRVIFSTRIEEVGQEYIESGWLADTDISLPLYSEQFPGFRVESDYREPEEIANLPVHRHFLDPRGLIAGAGTVFPGPANDLLHFTVEGFASHDLSRAALPTLNAIRPHLARAVSLTNQIARDRDRAIVESLQMIGTGVAITGPQGHLRASNNRFFEQLGSELVESRSRLRFANAFLEQCFQKALEDMSMARRSASIGIRRKQGSPMAVHLMPLVGQAREVFNSDGVLLLVAEADNVSVPNAELLKLLFDLTPVEALLARSLADGLSLTEIATRRQVSEATVRTQLRAVFHKTGVSRQTSLVKLLVGFGM